MIIPDKYLNLRSSLLNVSAHVLNEFKNMKVMTYLEVEASITKKLGEDVKYIYPYALSFLFLLNKIEYNSYSDTLKLKDENK